ncbi:MAG: hypothetical protein KBA18_01475 [Kiritimatiellae bacterium]|nr:hypothetical protein [Kiritimatiellia bacterium]
MASLTSYHVKFVIKKNPNAFPPIVVRIHARTMRHSGTGPMTGNLNRFAAPLQHIACKLSLANCLGPALIFHFYLSCKSITLLRMNDIPPKHSPETPYEAPESGSGLVAMYNAASHANAESFPVLKAFQDYIEAERAQARKRVMQLSIFFAVLMGVVVTGFLTAGMFMLRNMSDVQTKLLDVALAAKESPVPQPVVVSAPAAPAPDPSPFFEASVREISKAATELRTSLDKKMDGVSDIAAKVHDRVASQDSELGKLREELKKMQSQGEKLNQELAALKSVPKTVTQPAGPARVATPAAIPPAPVSQPKSAAAPAGKPVATAVVAKAAPSAQRATPVQQPERPASAPVAAVKPDTPLKTAAIAKFPPAVKDPPDEATGVTPPPVPAGRIATAIPLKMKNVGAIPWRVMIPD